MPKDCLIFTLRLSRTVIVWPERVHIIHPSLFSNILLEVFHLNHLHENEVVLTQSKLVPRAFSLGNGRKSPRDEVESNAALVGATRPFAK